MGSGGVNAYLSDGENSYTVTVWPYSVEDSDQTAAAWALLDRDVDKCDGPTQGLLRQKCAAGLASAWRWSNVIGNSEGAGDTLEKIRSSIVPSSASEALSSTLTEDTWIVGSAEDFVGLPTFSSYNRFGYFRTTRKLNGPNMKLRKGSVFALDFALTDEPRFIELGDALYRINVFNGPSIHFVDSMTAYKEDQEGFLAKAMHRLLTATPEELQQSEAYAEEVERNHQESRRRVEEYIASGDFYRALTRNFGETDSPPSPGIKQEQPDWNLYGKDM